MGKDDNAAPSLNFNLQQFKHMFKEGGWSAYAATIDFKEAVQIWACKTEVKGIDTRFNLEWLLPRNREGIGGRGSMPDNMFPLLDANAHRKGHHMFYAMIHNVIKPLAPHIVKKFPIEDYDTIDPAKGYDDEKYCVATDLYHAFLDINKQDSNDSLGSELESMNNLLKSFPGYPIVSRLSYNNFNKWLEQTRSKWTIFLMHPKTSAHETALMTNLSCTITAVDVDQHINHPISFGPLLAKMDTYNTSNAPNLHHYLDTLAEYLKTFYERTRHISIEQPSSFICNACFAPHNIKEYNKHENNYESDEINDQESENDDEDSDEQHSEYEDETETSAQYNEMQCIKCDSTFDCPSTYYGNKPLCSGCSDYQHQYKRQRF